MDTELEPPLTGCTPITENKMASVDQQYEQLKQLAVARQKNLDDSQKIHKLLREADEVANWIKEQICDLSSNPPDYCAGASPATVSPVALTTSSNAPVSAIMSSPAPSAPSPTQAPKISSVAPTPNACADSNDNTLIIDEIIGRKDCVWLSENPLFGYLCKFIDVAASCKKTCDACHYFYPATQGH